MTCQNYNMNGTHHMKYWQVKINIWQKTFGRLNIGKHNMHMHAHMHAYIHVYIHARLLLLLLTD